MLKKIALTALAGTLALTLAAAEPSKPVQPASNAKTQTSTTTAVAGNKTTVKHKRHRAKAPVKTSATKPAAGSAVK